MSDEVAFARIRDEFKANFDKDAGYISLGKVNFGDGVEGNGIVKDGVFFLRKEDIKTIVDEVFGEDNDVLKDLIRDGGGTQPFILFAGENNRVDGKSSPGAEEFWKKSNFGFNNEMANSPIDLPDANDREVVDFEPGEKRTWEDPGSSASGSIGIGRTDVSFSQLQGAYEKVTGLPVDRESMIKLAIALERRGNDAAESVEESLSEDFDWDDYERTDNRDYDNDRDDYYDRD